MCLEWFAEQTPGRRRPSRMSLLLAGWSLGSVGRAAARAARSSAESHQSALLLIDRLIEVGRPAGWVSVDSADAARGAARAAALRPSRRAAGSRRSIRPT